MHGSWNRTVVLVAAAFGLAVGAIAGVVTSRMMAAGGGSPEAAGPPAAAGPEAAQQGPPPATVRVGMVTEEPLQDRFDVIGRLQEVQRATVAAEVEGKIIAAPVEEGDRVEAGETVLVRVDPVWARAILETAEAQVASAEAELDQSRRDLAYLDQLLAAGSAKPKEVEDARATVKSDEAALAAALAAREEAATRVERLDIVAPFDGVVVDKMIEVGQWVEPGAAVVELISTDRIDAVIDVPERLINRVSLGGIIEVYIEALQQAVDGEVIAVIPSGVSAARTFPVKVRLDDEGGALKPGMSVIARLPVGETTQVLTVPRDAVLFQNGAARVWAAIPAGEGGDVAAMPQAMPFNVEVLFGVGDRYAVRSVGGGPALAPQMPVVIEGAEMLFPTQPLVILDTNAAQANAE